MAAAFCILSSGAVLSAQATSSRTAAAFARAAKNPLELRAFLERMPKGGELHYHLAGGIYAETVLQDAAEDGLCIITATHSLAPNAGMTKSSPVGPICLEGQRPAVDVFRDQRFYDDMVDAWSMRSFVPSTGVSGHDHFFSSPSRAGTNRRHLGEWIDEAATRAAGQNEQYLEIMTSTTSVDTLKAADAIGWKPDLPAMRTALLASDLRNDIAAGPREINGFEATRNTREHCGTPEASRACKVLVKYIQTVSRGNQPQRVFAQTLLAFELASADPRVVGLNFAQPEDGYLSMADYHLHMQMLDYLHSVYPKVHISLHAGELAFGMVPPEGLKFHIREAVELGHAERIGHGVDVVYENDSAALLKEMADRHVMVEINITSNDVILGVTGSQHPLPIYRSAHVPFALSTDDEGVSRIDLTHEYVRAVTDFGLGYEDLKKSARSSIEHSFLPGVDLWSHLDDFSAMNTACATASSRACRGFLKGSEKATQEWELELRFKAFEGSL